MNVAMPARVAALPRHGELPILFTTLVQENVPDFRVNDPRKTAAAMVGRRCAICGLKLEYWITFFMSAGGLALLKPTSCDAGMHEDCARYALAVCPYLNRSRQRSERPVPEAVISGLGEQPALPAETYLIWTRNYKVILHGNGLTYAVPGTITRRERLP